jgi:hypothetical protein
LEKSPKDRAASILRSMLPDRHGISRKLGQDGFDGLLILVQAGTDIDYRMLLRAESLDTTSALLSRGRRRGGAPEWGSEGQPGTGASGVRTGRERCVRDPLAHPESNEPDTPPMAHTKGFRSLGLDAISL